jgi:hypothetical protein
MGAVSRSTTFTLTLRTPTGGAYRRLRRTLKTALRRDRLQAVDIRACPHGVRPPRRAGSDLAAGERKMSLGKRKGSDFMPVFKYDAKAGSFYKQDRVLTQDGWSNEQADVGDDLRAGRVIFDLDTIEVGWLYFPKGAAPETVLFPVGQDIGDAPDKNFKQGFRMIVKLDGDEPREFMSTANATWYAIDALHTAWGKIARADSVAKVKLTNMIESKTSNGTNFTPVFELAGLVARPSDLPRPQPTTANGGLRKPAKPTRTGGVHRGDMDEPIPF